MTSETQIIDYVYNGVINEVEGEYIFQHKLPSYIGVHTKVKNKLNEFINCMNTSDGRRICNDLAHKIMEFFIGSDDNE